MPISKQQDWTEDPYILDTPVRAHSSRMSVNCTLQMQFQQNAELENFSGILSQATRIDISLLYVSSLLEHLGQPRFSVEAVPHPPPMPDFSAITCLEKIIQSAERIDHDVACFLCHCLAPLHLPEDLGSACVAPHLPPDGEPLAWISIHSAVDNELSATERLRAQKKEHKSPYKTAPRIPLAKRLKHIFVWVTLAAAVMFAYHWFRRT